MYPFRAVLWSLSVFALLHVCISDCYRKPQGATGDRSPVDENYQILIEGNPSTYLPGQTYNLSLSCAVGLKFISFTLLLEAEDPNSGMIGEFRIIDKAETKFSEQCTNMIESSNNNIKHHIDVSWVAPDHPESGCVLFKAAVLQHRNVWFIDDGYLTKRLCREHVDEVHSQTPPVDVCCACEEAKYEIVIERKWNRNTHPKYFPSEAWRTRLGVVIGASHTANYTFWNYGELASSGLRELAEHGASAALEMEIKNHSETGSIRTIIKAPEIKYKLNVVSKTLATVRVGPRHHMISFVSKIDPSPDWILGVAALELCLANCTWVDRKELNLYPWDAGTDAGPSYMSADQAQKPPDVVRRITSTFPSDDRSPFYDSTGAPIKPLAVLHVTRKRTYGRCVDDLENDYPTECATHPWNEWSECNVKCGSGKQYRVRSYKDIALAERVNCNRRLREIQDCTGSCFNVDVGLPQSSDSRYSSAECELTMWSKWSECSNTCGRGTQTRSRGFVNAYASEKCQSGFTGELQQTIACEGKLCGGNIPSNSYYGNDGQDLNINGFDGDDSQRMDFDLTDRDTTGSFNFGTDNLRSQIQRPTATRYNNGENPYENSNNLYGSKTYAEDNQQLAGDLEQPYGEVSRKRNDRNRSTYPKQFGKTNTWGFDEYSDQTTPTTTPRSLRVPSFTTARTNFYSTPSPYFGINQPYGSIDEGMDVKADDNFCLYLPVASQEPCNSHRVFLKNYWFYDASEMECKLFTADNCDQNKNKFFSLQACQETCGGQQSNWSNNDAMTQDTQNRGAYRNAGGMNTEYRNRGGLNQDYQNRDGYRSPTYEMQTSWT